MMMSLVSSEDLLSDHRKKMRFTSLICLALSETFGQSPGGSLTQIRPAIQERSRAYGIFPNPSSGQRLKQMRTFLKIHSVVQLCEINISKMLKTFIYKVLLNVCYDGLWVFATDETEIGHFSPSPLKTNINFMTTRTHTAATNSYTRIKTDPSRHYSSV